MANGISIQQTTSGAYRAQVRRDGKRRYGPSRATEEEAHLAGAMVLVEMGAEMPAELAVAPSIHDLLWKHLGETSYSPKTEEDYRSLIRKLPASILWKPISELTALSVTRIYRDLAKATDKDGKRKWSDHRIQRFHGFLSSSFSTAIIYEWAKFNPCRDAKVKRVNKKRDGANLDLDTIYDIIERSSKVNTQLPIFFRVALNSGARRGELVALRWEHVGADSIWIAESHSEARIYGEPDRRVHVGKTKTGVKGIRRVGMPAALLAEVQTLRGDGPYVFSHDGGKTAWLPSYVSRAWERLAKGTGIRLHDLRHYQATHLLGQGVPVHEVSARLGHASVKTTQDTYGHAIPAKDVANAEKFAL